MGDKHQLCDQGLAAHLLGVTEEKLTSGARERVSSSANCSRASRRCRHVGHLHWLGERSGDRLVDKIVLYTGNTAGRGSDGVALIPRAMLY